MRQPSPLKEEGIARALYSNEADYPGELSFEKDDLLRIISKKPEIEGCSEGWWLCVDKSGRRGIAPGNRLLPLPREAMQRFDDGFFRVAQPFMDDFFAFHSSPFDDPFFRSRPSFSSSVRDRLYEGTPQIRRMNSCDDALKNVGVVRNIPIRVEKNGGPAERMCQSTVNIAADPPPATRRFSDFPSEFRQTTTFGPPAPPRRSVDSLRLPPEQETRASSDEEERRSVRSERSPQRTLIIPSAVPGRTIEIPLGDAAMQRSFSQSWNPEPPRPSVPKSESQLERLTQRLRTLAARPFRAPASPTSKVPAGPKEADRSPSPSSSGIGADLTDSSHSGEENKRTSDLSSLSGSEQNEMPRHQPYLGRLVTHPGAIQPTFDGGDSPIKNQGGLAVDEDIRRNETLPWNLVPTTIQPGPPRGLGEVLEEIQSRKRLGPVLPPAASKPATNGTSKMERPSHLLNYSTPSTEEKRLSSSSTSSTAASLDTPPSSILVTKPNVDKPRGRVTFADETTSNSSSGDNSSLEYASIQKPPRGNEDRILEEDDLESVISDRDSLFQDYAYLDDVVSGRSAGIQLPRSRINPEDRQIVRFYAPQLEQHTESLSQAIEEFLEVVEKHLPPREFVQKGKLIILAAHKLIYIGDSVSQCVRDRIVSKAVRECADELCEHLKDCVRATKIAAEEFPEIRSMQAMVDTIIAVSKSAHRLKLLIGECY